MMTPRTTASTRHRQRTDTPQQRRLINAARRLARDVTPLRFTPPITHVYNPLDYAAAAHHQYIRLAQPSTTRVLMLGMNPGPWGMAQTGVPFGQIEAVRDWLGIDAVIGRPAQMHPKRPVEGWACRRSEVSGQRLWGLFRQRYGTPGRFFREHFVANYCPLVFMEASGRNRTPDKLPADQRQTLNQACDRHLNTVIQTLQPEVLVGIGVYAENCLRRVAAAAGLSSPVVRIAHPSPASPAANRHWAGIVTEQLISAGVWSR